MHARAPRARVKISTRTFGQPMILRIISYLTYICWEIDNFVIKSNDIFRRFSFVRIFLKNYRVTITTTLDTSCSENIMVLSARRGFLHACIF